MHESRDAVILMAEKFMAAQGYRHGPCIGADRKFSDPRAVWEVEFAHAGLNSRSDTADPPSITLIVDVNGRTVRAAEWM